MVRIRFSAKGPLARRRVVVPAISFGAVLAVALTAAVIESRSHKPHPPSVSTAELTPSAASVAASPSALVSPSTVAPLESSAGSSASGDAAPLPSLSAPASISATASVSRPPAPSGPATLPLTVAAIPQTVPSVVGNPAGPAALALVVQVRVMIAGAAVTTDAPVVVASDGTTMRSLPVSFDPKADSRGTALALSPDGKQVAYTVGGTGPATLHVVDLVRGTEARFPLTALAKSVVVGLSWSLAGLHIAAGDAHSTVEQSAGFYPGGSDFWSFQPATGGLARLSAPAVPGITDMAQPGDVPTDVAVPGDNYLTTAALPRIAMAVPSPVFELGSAESLRMTLSPDGSKIALVDEASLPAGAFYGVGVAVVDHQDAAGTMPPTPPAGLATYAVGTARFVAILGWAGDTSVVIAAVTSDGATHVDTVDVRSGKLTPRVHGAAGLHATGVAIAENALAG